MLTIVTLELFENSITFSRTIILVVNHAKLINLNKVILFNFIGKTV